MLSAEKLKFLRLLHGITQKEIGTEMGISKNYISMIENRKENYSQDWHDKYVNSVYKIAEQKKNSENIEKVEEIKEEIKKTKTKKK